MSSVIFLIDVVKRRYKVLLLTFVAFILILYIWLPTNDQPTPVKVVFSNACRLFTLNIWFGDFKTQRRMAILGKTIEKLRPSIITFQEVTSKNLGYLKHQAWFKEYHMIPNEIPRDQGYCVVILSVYPVVKWRSVPFKNSRMGRNLLLAEFKAELDIAKEYHPHKHWFSFFNSDPVKHVYFTIATSHLESMAYSTLERENQLVQSLQILNEYDDVCFMGDLNLESKVDGEVELPQPWVDAWLSIKNNTHSNGYTWDPVSNSNIKLSEPHSTTDRFDRVLCKLLNFAVESVDIVGTKPVNGVLFSDHYALFTRLKFGPSEMASQYPLNQKAAFVRPKDWKKFVHGI